jgi:hypothetical protein
MHRLAGATLAAYITGSMIKSPTAVTFNPVSFDLGGMRLIPIIPFPCSAIAR